MSAASSAKPFALALVTGGGGFLGSAIVRLLLEKGYRVRSFARGDYPSLVKTGVEVVQGEIATASAVATAVEGCDVVFHVAAKAGVWGRDDDFHRTNVVGTENVIAACKRHGVSRLVYTSTPSVVFNGRDMEGANESAPYADHYEAAYPRTKAEAERLALGANSGELGVVALRPHLIWGPGDRHLIPRIVERARAGKLRIVGDGTNRIDTIYIDNAAEAHLLAAERLSPNSPIAGKAYFITQGEPRPLWEIVNRILQAAGLPPVERKISARSAYVAGAVLEFAYKLLGLQSEPRMTRFVARELSTSHWFDITAARRDLGFAPRVSFDEGMRRLQDCLQEGGLKSSP